MWQTFVKRASFLGGEVAILSLSMLAGSPPPPAPQIQLLLPPMLFTLLDSDCTLARIHIYLVDYKRAIQNKEKDQG